MLLHLGRNVITFRTLLHLGQLLHLGLQRIVTPRCSSSPPCYEQGVIVDVIYPPGTLRCRFSCYVMLLLNL